MRTDAASMMEEGADQAQYYHRQVCPAMEALRAPVDQLEMIVDKEMWPMPPTEIFCLKSEISAGRQAEIF